MKVQLTYTFIFDPSETWELKTSFEGMIANYLEKIGLKAEFVKTESGKENILYVSKTDALLNPQPKETSEPSVKQVKAKLVQKRGFDGKFEKTN